MICLAVLAGQSEWGVLEAVDAEGDCSEASPGALLGDGAQRTDRLCWRHQRL